MKIKLMLMILAILLFSTLFAKSDEIYFKFQVNSHDEIESLSKIISIDNVQDKVVFAYANSNEIKDFQKLNYNYEILPNPGSLINPKMTDGNEKTWTAYPTYEAYVNSMYQFATDYPSICTVTNIGNSVDGREILVAKISDNVNTEEDEPEFFYTGQMHGDEVVDYIMLLDLIEYLLSNYGSNSEVDNLVNNMEIYINPLSNPDGTYAGGNSSVSGATRYNANSIDLNRNFPDPEDGDHPDGNAYQPENVAMMNFADAHSFVLSANLHSGAEVVNYPWDTWARLHADDNWFQTISREYATAAQNNSPAGYFDDQNNGITNGYAWYSISGGRQDYMNYFKYCREITLELSSVKMLNASELQNHWNYNRESLINYMKQALFGIRGIVTDVNGNPLAATIEVISHDLDNSQVITDPDVGDYHRMIAPGTYNLRFSATGYDDITVNNVVVTEGNSTNVDVVFGSSQVTQSFAFNAGWDLISLNTHPTDMSPSSIFDSVIGNLLQIKDLSQSYDPSLPAYMNTLNTLADGKGYWINFGASSNLDIVANAVDFASTTINLTSGWNLIGYPCQNNQAVENAFSDISSYLVQVKNLTQSYDPSLPAYLNTLTEMQPNYGYWVNVNQNCSFTYPNPVLQANSPEMPLVRNCDWEPVIYPNNSATLYGQIVYDNVSVNDLVGAFVNDECRGVGEISEYNGEYFTTITLQLAENGENVELKYYDLDNDDIYSCNNSITAEFGEIIGNYPDALYMINVLPTALDEDVISSNIALDNYPNPFNPVTTIKYNIPKSEYTTVEIYNILGQKVKTLVNSIQKAGENSVIWNGTNSIGNGVASGVYMYKIKSGKHTAIKKMILMK